MVDCGDFHGKRSALDPLARNASNLIYIINHIKKSRKHKLQRKPLKLHFLGLQKVLQKSQVVKVVEKVVVVKVLVVEGVKAQKIKQK